MVVNTNKSGIYETFNYENYAKNSKKLKLMKILTIEKVPEVIRNGKVVHDNQINTHGIKNTKFAYIEGNTQIGGMNISIRLAIKKSVQSNKFWVHYVDIKNDTNGATFADGDNAKQATFRTVDIADYDTTINKKSQEKFPFPENSDEKEYSIPAEAGGSEGITREEAREEIDSMIDTDDDTAPQSSNRQGNGISQSTAQRMAAAKARSKAAEEEDAMPREYSIVDGVVDENGNVLNNVVLLDTDIFRKSKNRSKTLRQFIYDKMAGKKVTVSDENGEQTVIEFARKNDRVKKDGAENAHKVLDKLATKSDRNSQLAAAHAEEIVYVSRESEPHSDENSHQWMDRKGWDFRKAILMSKDGNLYEATLNIANARDGRRILYDINKIKSIGTATLSDPSDTTGDSHIDPMLNASIPAYSENVKRNFSFSENSDEKEYSIPAEAGGREGITREEERESGNMIDTDDDTAPQSSNRQGNGISQSTAQRMAADSRTDAEVEIGELKRKKQNGIAL